MSRNIFWDFVKTLEQVFGSGELDITRDNFTNCGIRHTLTPQGYEMDQTEYLQALKPIQHSDLTGKPADQTAAPQVQQMFHSLVMAVAYTLITRVDLCIYCVALQRVTAAPSNLHVRRLNALVRWAQRNPLAIKYCKMKCGMCLRTFTAAGFKREELTNGATVATGRAVRGAVYIRMASNSPVAGRAIAPAVPSELFGHLIDWHCGSIKQVTRATFTSEALAAIAASDHSIMLAYTMEEILQGPRTPTQGIRRLENPINNGTYRIEVLLDAMSVLQALAQERIKAPCEKSFLIHLLWLRELMGKKLLEVGWVDTRDQYADGLTKGSVSRELLTQVAKGFVTNKHPIKWIKDVKTTKTISFDEDANRPLDDH